MIATIAAAGGRSRLDHVPDEDILSDLAARGAVLLRGFDLDLDAFSTFIERFCGHVTFDPARRGVLGNAQAVDAGTDAVGLHLENGFTAFPPELVFFYCAVAAETGSETTICDGQQVWPALSARTRGWFTDNDIKVRRTIPAPIWRAYVANELDVEGGPDAVGDAHLDELVARNPRQSLRLVEDGAIDYALLVQGRTHGLFDTRAGLRQLPARPPLQL